MWLEPLYVAYDDYKKCYYCSKQLSSNIIENYYFDNFKKFSKFCMQHVNDLRDLRIRKEYKI